VPDGLLRTELLRGQNGRWRIQTAWRDGAALDAMRAASEAPAALRLTWSVVVIGLGRLVTFYLTSGCPPHAAETVRYRSFPA